MSESDKSNAAITSLNCSGDDYFRLANRAPDWWDSPRKMGGYAREFFYIMSLVYASPPAVNAYRWAVQKHNKGEDANDAIFAILILR